jgi:hypothetical protein
MERGAALASRGPQRSSWDHNTTDKGIEDGPGSVVDTGQGTRGE